jgi:hypothetical protein
MWWRSWPAANIGLLTGAGLLVLDIDPKNGGNEALVALTTRHGELPPTPTVATGGGGLHFYFAVAGPVPCRIGLARGIDVKADGGYVVAPESVHASGEAYTWVRGRTLDDLPPAVAPSWLLADLVQPRIAPRFETRGTSFETPKGGFETGGAPIGGRNNHLISVAGRMRRQGLGGLAQRESLGDLHRKCARWTSANLERLRAAAPAAVPGLDDRAVDNWEALLAIADAVGGSWPESVRVAALALSSAERGGQDDAHGELLLADVRDIFTDTAAAALPAKALLGRLIGMEERPWPEASRGQPLTARQLGVRLGRFGISSRTVRTGSVTARCYVRADFDDAFSRYVSDQSVSPVTTAESEPNLGESHLSRLRLVTDAASEEKPRDLEGVTDVTDADDDEAAYVALERAAIKDFGS